MAGQRGAEFGQLVHQLIVMEKVRTLEETAQALGVDYHTLYSRVNGRVTFSPEEIRALLRVLPDMRLLQYFADGSPFVVVERSNPEADSEQAELKNTLMREAHKTVIEAADILEVVEKALEDQKVDHRDALLIRKEVDHCERALASIRRLLDLKDGARKTA